MTAIRTLCKDIYADLEKDPTGPGVPELLGAYIAKNDDWKMYRIFDDGFYARNLVEVNDLFELIVICWQAGQASPIHNHAGQHCWMAILEGTIEETHYQTPAADHSGPLAPSAVHSYETGAVGYINDDIALHVIRPTQDALGVSLHLYSRPIETCNIYCPDTGEIRPRRVSYHSIEGKRVG